MLQLAFLPSIGPGEWIIILVVILLLFGATRIPQLARSLGKGASEFKKGLREGGEGDGDDDGSDDDKASREEK